LALNAAAQTLYCLNRITNSISIINTASQAVSSEIAIGTNPTPAAIRAGRGFLYDAKLSGNGTGACAGCHIDGDMDHLAWNLGDPTLNVTTGLSKGTSGNVVTFHPMKGPMVTQTLHGLANLSPYHWRGDKINFAAFNAAFAALMGGPQLSSNDMAAYTNFVNTILFVPNPNENLDRSLPASIQGGNPVQGLTDYMTLPLTNFGGTTPTTCNACHTANPGTGSNRVIQNFQPQVLKVPELRNLYQKQLFNRFNLLTIDGFGLDHDGHVSLFTDFFKGNAFDAYSAQQKTDMSAYMLCFDTGTAPAVGFSVTLNSSNVANSTLQGNWTTLQARAAAGDVDLVAKGTLNQTVHGLLYQPSTQTYVADNAAVYTQAQLQALLQAGDTLTFMGVYPGTGTATKH
jgi:YVTN family beta-propeller protein